MSSGGSVKKVGPMCLYVCWYVCPSILDSGEKTAGPIGTGKAPFDAPERWKRGGRNCPTAATGDPVLSFSKKSIKV